MTSKLKCPVCGKTELIRMFNPLTGKYFEDYDCPFRLCNFRGNKVAVDALTQAKQDLEIARKALEEMQHWLGVVRCSMVSHLNNQNNTLLEHYETDPTVQNIDKAKSILKQYLEQIEHKEV